MTVIAGKDVVKTIARYLDREQLSWSEKALELWFAPKPFESEEFYGRLGVRILKRYVVFSSIKNSGFASSTSVTTWTC